MREPDPPPGGTLLLPEHGDYSRDPIRYLLPASARAGFGVEAVFARRRSAAFGWPGGARTSRRACGLADLLRASDPMDGIDRRSGAPHAFRRDVQRSLGHRDTHPAVAGALPSRLESPVLGTLSAGRKHLKEVLNYVAFPVSGVSGANVVLSSYLWRFWPSCCTRLPTCNRRKDARAQLSEYLEFIITGPTERVTIFAREQNNPRGRECAPCTPPRSPILSNLALYWINRCGFAPCRCEAISHCRPRRHQKGGSKNCSTGCVKLQRSPPGPLLECFGDGCARSDRLPA